MRITVLGAGAWGTTLACALHRSGQIVTLWGHDRTHLEALRQSGRNDRYLPGVPLPREWTLQPDLAQAVANAEAVVLAVPSRAFRQVSGSLHGFTGLVISVTKGLEHETGLTMCGILGETAPEAQIAALSGPTLAPEVARGIPTAIVAASPESATARGVQALFHGPTFRVYTSQDRLGVELGGALKNVIAIAAGVGDGLGLGDNSKAALVTRAIAEIRRLGAAAGAQPETFGGLSGLGDLVVTCFSPLSRNRGLGEHLGRGEKPAAILAGLVSVAEGHPTAQSAYQLARRLQVATPIIDQVYAMLYQGQDPRQAVADLMRRDTKAED